MGIFNNDDDNGSSKHVCPSHSYAENAADPIVGDMSFYHLNMIISGACAAAVVLIIVFFNIMHSTHYSKPNEQSKYMRIGMLIPTYAVGSFIAVAAPSAHVYIEPWLVFIESLSLVTFFLLLCDYVHPHAGQREAFFRNRITKVKTGKEPINSLSWFRTRWLLIFQFPIVALLVAVVTDITQAAGVYCEFETKPYFAKLWLSILSNVAITVGVLSCYKFYMQLKEEFAPFKAMKKFFAFKAIVGLTFIQGILFWILIDTHAMKETNILTYADIQVGIPSLVICIEMIPMSLFFCYSYSWVPYMRGHEAEAPQIIAKSEVMAEENGRLYHGGPLGIKAYIDMFNIIEIFRGIIFGVSSYGEAKQTLHSVESQEETSYLSQQQYFNNNNNYNNDTSYNNYNNNYNNQEQRY